jgi:hypothetical protein
MLRLRLESTNTMIRTRKERVLPYFVHGDSGSDIFGGRIRPGNYTLETNDVGGCVVHAGFVCVYETMKSDACRSFLPNGAGA